MGFGIAFHEEKMEITGTSTAVSCFSPAVVEYLHALVRAANPPPLPSLQCSGNPPSSEPSRSKQGKLPPATASTKHAKPSTSLPNISRSNSSSKNATQASKKAGFVQVSKSKTVKPPSGTSPSNPFSKTTTQASKIGSKAESTSISISKPLPPATREVTAESDFTSLDRDSFQECNLDPSEGAAGSDFTSLETESLVDSALDPSLPANHETTQLRSQDAESTQLSNSKPWAAKQPTSPSKLLASSATLTSPISISSSPIREDPNSWIPSLDLYINDKSVLESSRWLNDNIITVAQHLLKEQCQGKIFGWSSTQCSKKTTKEKFPPVPPQSPFIQILHIAECHWITLSNIDGRRDGGVLSHSSDTVRIYDSGMGLNVALSTQLNVCQFLKPSAERIQFDIMNVLPQLNTHDCGLYAIAFATELSFGYDPVFCDFVTEASAMRSHLISCFEKGKLERFPCKSARNVRFGRRVRKSLGVDIFCSCRLPNDPTQSMILCNQCRKWFHTECEPVDGLNVRKWICTSCNTFLDTLK